MVGKQKKICLDVLFLELSGGLHGVWIPHEREKKKLEAERELTV